MTSMAQALRTALFHFVWQGLAVALLLWIALFLLRKRSAQARYLAGCLALGTLAVLPVVTACLAYRAPAAGWSERVGTVAAVTANYGGALVNRGPAVANWLVRLEPWALPVWSLGVLFFSLRLVWGCWRISAMRRRANPADASILATVAGLGARMGLARPVRVLTAALPDGPSVAGWLRPVLLLPPATVLGLTPQQLEAVLAHELAHIRRYDHLVNAAQTLVETLLFYHPAVWWASARVRDERELCCDDLAVRACGDALCFARALTKLERLRVTAPAAALGSTGGPLLYRVQRLIGAGHQECAPSKVSGILAFSLGLVCLAVNVHWARGQEQPVKADQTFTMMVSYHGDDEAGVTVDLGGAAVLHRTPVAYPEGARKSGIQGTVAVQVSLDATGNVSDAHVVSGPLELRRAVMSSIFEWHFTQDAAGSLRTVNVTFQKAEADAETKEAGPVTVRGMTARLANTVAEATVPEPAQGVVAVSLTGPDDPATSPSPQVQELRKRLDEQRAALASRDTPQTREQIRKLEGELAAQERLGTTGRVELQPGTSRAQEEVGLAGINEEGAVYLHGNGLEPPVVTGRTLVRIDIIGLSAAARSDLLSRLPVHVGDTLSDESLKAVKQVVLKFDEHMACEIISGPNGTIRIRFETPAGSVQNDK